MSAPSDNQSCCGETRTGKFCSTCGRGARGGRSTLLGASIVSGLLWLLGTASAIALQNIPDAPDADDPREAVEGSSFPSEVAPGPTPTSAASASPRPADEEAREEPPIPAFDMVAVYARGDTLEEMLSRWASSFGARTVPKLKIAGLGGGGFALVHPEIQSRLGGVPDDDSYPAIEGLGRAHELPAVDFDDTDSWLEVAPLVMTSSINLRLEPKKESGLVRPLPVGTAVIAALGAVGASPAGRAAGKSALGARTWVYVVAGRGLAGWLWAGKLEPITGCIPYAEADKWAGSERWTISRAYPARTDSWLGIRSDGATSEIVLFEPDPTCALRPLRTARVQGQVEQAFLTALQDGGPPDTLFASSLVNEGVRWSAFGKDGLEPFWILDVPLDSGILGEERVAGDGPYRTKGAEAAYYPLRMRWPGKEKEPALYLWDGERLATQGESATDQGGPARE